jgi:hypothetical protein
MSDFEQLAQVLLGPLGALALALYVALRLNRDLKECRETLRAEQAARLADHQAMTRSMLKLQERVTLAVELFAHRPCLAQTGARRELPTLPGSEEP